MTMELTNDNWKQWIAWATDRIVELEQAYDDHRAVLEPLYSRFEHDEQGCVSCSACPVCGIEPGTQFMKGVGHYPGCRGWD